MILPLIIREETHSNMNKVPKVSIWASSPEEQDNLRQLFFVCNVLNVSDISFWS